MRLLSYTTAHDPAPRWGVLDGERVIEAVTPASVAHLIAAPDRDDVLARLAKGPATVDLNEVTLRSPIDPARNVFAVGANYRAHVAESAHSSALPDRPIFFTKATTAVTGPGIVVVDPSLTSRVDWEVELGAVLGSGGRHLDAGAARAAIFGYVVANDLSARDQQHDRPEGQWFLGKSLDGFCPLGPWLVTADEVPDPQRLHLRLTVNGAVKQDAGTEGMIFPVVDLIVELSRFVTLRAGDILLTGTPAGVGDARTPREYLHDGDVVTAEIAGLGSLTNRIAYAGVTV
jgi:2-keto-4-pentenoate hydratase/2-oxohepta-3-ene-1,7-dioic acid hydratase in catechol pathway